MSFEEARSVYIMHKPTQWGKAKKQPQIASALNRLSSDRLLTCFYRLLSALYRLSFTRLLIRSYRLLSALNRLSFSRL